MCLSVGPSVTGMVSKTNCMKQSHSWQANSRSSSKDIPPPFMESRGSLLCTQQPDTGPYPKPDASSPHLPNPISLRSILILSSHLHLGLPSGPFPSDFPTKILYAFHISPICHEDVLESGCKAPLILNLSTRWSAVSFTLRPLCPQRKSSRYPLHRKLGGPQCRSGHSSGEERHSLALPGIEPLSSGP
jgi:hypothetical protein